MANATTALAAALPPDITNHEGAAAPPSHTELYVVMVIMSFLSVIGTGGNATVLYVFARKRDRVVSTLFILTLAVVDFITCLVVIPFTIYMEYVDFLVDYDLVCKAYMFLVTSNIPFSALAMTAIAVDRYFCICHPFLNAITLQRARIIIAGLILFAGTLGIAVSLMHGVYQELPYAVVVNHNQSLLNHNTYPDGDSIATASSAPVKTFVKFTGRCDQNELVVSASFQWYYQKFYTSMFLVCLLVVVVLYVMIYKSVLLRRTQRLNQKRKSLYLIEVAKGKTVAAADDRNTQKMLLEDMKNGSSYSESSRKSGKMTESDVERTILKMSKDKVRMANLKTAAMLFVVAVVFIVTFMPSFLMALQLMPYNMTVFYMYFANYVANPFIYSFMNKNFRDDLSKLFC